MQASLLQKRVQSQPGAQEHLCISCHKPEKLHVCGPGVLPQHSRPLLAVCRRLLRARRWRWHALRLGSRQRASKRSQQRDCQCNTLLGLYDSQVVLISVKVVLISLLHDVICYARVTTPQRALSLVLCLFVSPFQERDTQTPPLLLLLFFRMVFRTEGTQDCFLGRVFAWLTFLGYRMTNTTRLVFFNRLRVLRGSKHKHAQITNHVQTSNPH